MILKKLTILNYRNIATAELEFSPKVNCFVGQNGEGKTNVLDAIYFMKQHQKKHVRRNKKEYKRLTEHIGLLPLIIASPNDATIISGGSEERRRLMDMVISQYDTEYMTALLTYNKALQQRNAMLKAEEEPNPDIMNIYEEMMAENGERIYAKRQAFIEEFTPVFQQFYAVISGGNEQVSLRYNSHCQRGPLLDIIQRDRQKDRIVGYSLHGIHKDDLEMNLDGYPIKREGSQGQNKTYMISLKLAQFDFLKRTGSKTTPLLLLDDIFDKLDAQRVEQIVNLVSGDAFGQIFITDTNREHLDKILERLLTDVPHVDEPTCPTSVDRHAPRRFWATTRKKERTPLARSLIH